MAKVNLLRIKFGNILSFRDIQEIYFTAESKYTNTPTNYIQRPSAIEDSLIVPVTAFYGANASGKSNIIKIFGNLLVNLLSRDEIKFNSDFYTPFLLDDVSNKQNSELEIDFCVNETRYILGIIFSDKNIIKENLVSFKDKIKTKFYTREGNRLTYHNKELINKFDAQYIEDSFSKRNDLLVVDLLDTRKLASIEECFIGLKEISKLTIANIFSTVMQIDDLAEDLYNSKELKDKVVELLKFADLGITGINVSLEENSNFFSKSKTGKSYKIEFEHKGKDGKKYPLPILQESWGTGQFARYLTLFIPAFINGGVFCVDELEENLHPMMLAKIIEMFNNPSINTAGAQLIFTTHNTSILRANTLKRDEIWFVEKNEEGCSEVYPLTEFKAIREGFNFEKGYFEGRFGAIPYLGDIEELAKILDEDK